jgi:purine-nucleoside/S-methyl-5'-thioadenosine phosphorylase / adenosine deaminase
MTDEGYTANWPAPSRVRTWQTTRAGGVSKGRYSSLNLGLHVGDDAAAVAANREHLRSRLDLPAEPVWLDQVHGRRLLKLDRGETGPADGAISSSEGKVLAVMTADCLPVFLTTRSGDIVAIAHAGWRGLAAGVLQAAVEAMARDPAGILAWLGPGISQDAFEVGDEVLRAFTGADPGSAAAFRRNERGRWQADLYALARRALNRAGVEAVFGAPACTFGEPGRYFSHRREAPCGRMASLIWLEKGEIR